jgi:hypothetical protein
MRSNSTVKIVAARDGMVARRASGKRPNLNAFRRGASIL